MMVNGVATSSEEKLEDIRNALTGTLLAQYGEQGIYCYDRRIKQTCMLSYQQVLLIIREKAPHLLTNR